MVLVALGPHATIAAMDLGFVEPAALVKVTCGCKSPVNCTKADFATFGPFESQPSCQGDDIRMKLGIRFTTFALPDGFDYLSPVERPAWLLQIL